MDDSAIMNENAIRRIEAAIAGRRKALDSLEKSLTKSVPKRYIIPFRFPVGNGSASVLFAPQTRGVVVDRDVKFFHLHDIAFSVSAIGTLGALGAVELPLAPSDMTSNVFVFDWTLRDTHTDREWTDGRMPHTFLPSSLVGPAEVKPPAIPPGTRLEMTVFPRLLATSIPSGVESITEYNLQVAFIGHEVLA